MKHCENVEDYNFDNKDSMPFNLEREYQTLQKERRGNNSALAEVTTVLKTEQSEHYHSSESLEIVSAHYKKDTILSQVRRKPIRKKGVKDPLTNNEQSSQPNKSLNEQTHPHPMVRRKFKSLSRDHSMQIVETVSSQGNKLQNEVQNKIKVPPIVESDYIANQRKDMILKLKKLEETLNHNISLETILNQKFNNNKIAATAAPSVSAKKP